MLNHSAYVVFSLKTRFPTILRRNQSRGSYRSIYTKVLSYKLYSTFSMAASFFYYPNNCVTLMFDGKTSTHKFGDCSGALNEKLQILLGNGDGKMFFFINNMIVDLTMDQHQLLSPKEKTFLQECIDHHEFENGPYCHFRREYIMDEGICMI